MLLLRLCCYFCKMHLHQEAAKRTHLSAKQRAQSLDLSRHLHQSELDEDDDPEDDPEDDPLELELVSEEELDEAFSAIACSACGAIATACCTFNILQ